MGMAGGEGITARGEDLCLGGGHGDQEDTQREKKGIFRAEEAFNPSQGCGETSLGVQIREDLCHRQGL